MSEEKPILKRCGVKLLSAAILMVIISSFLAIPVLAATESVEIPNPLKVRSISELIDRVVNYIIGIATIIFPLVIIYGAFQLLTTGGDIEKAILGRKTITYAVIGYVLILISKGITMIVANILGAK